MYWLIVYDNYLYTLFVWEEKGAVLHGLLEERGYTSKPEGLLEERGWTSKPEIEVQIQLISLTIEVQI